MELAFSTLPLERMNELKPQPKQANRHGYFTFEKLKNIFYRNRKKIKTTPVHCKGDLKRPLKIVHYRTQFTDKLLATGSCH